MKAADISRDVIGQLIFLCNCHQQRTWRTTRTERNKNFLWSNNLEFLSINLSPNITVLMTSIPIDFTTQSSSVVKCTCGKKAIGQCTCEGVCFFSSSTTCSRVYLSHANLLISRLPLETLPLMVVPVHVEWDLLAVLFAQRFSLMLACTCGLATGKAKVAATVCPCQGAEGACVCAAGRCACSGCGRQEVYLEKAWIRYRRTRLCNGLHCYHW